MRVHVTWGSPVGPRWAPCLAPWTLLSGVFRAVLTKINIELSGACLSDLTLVATGVSLDGCTLLTNGPIADGFTSTDKEECKRNACCNDVPGYIFFDTGRNPFFPPNCYPYMCNTGEKLIPAGGCNIEIGTISQFKCYESYARTKYL